MSKRRRTGRIRRDLKMRLCEVLRNTISSEYDIIKQEKIEEQILINFILCIANE